MFEINFPVSFLNAYDLEKRWNCGLHTIQSMAETQLLRFFIRPVALEIALGPYFNNTDCKTLKKLSEYHLDYRDIYLLFKDKFSRIAIKKLGQFNIDDISKSARPIIYAEFCDLVIPLDDVLAFENTHCDNIKPGNGLHLLSQDFSCFILHNREYRFGDMQAKIIKRLFDAHESNRPWVYGKHLLSGAGSGSDRIQSVFNHNTDWRKVILSDGKGKYRINLPPNKNQLTLF